ncbi:MAG: hypothetical protein VW683_01535 [Betaproteobacteria bacterium]|jgi:hypothetical protein
MAKDTYKKLKTVDFGGFLKTTYPKLSASDIKRGYIYRYFLARIGTQDLEAFEVDRNTYDKFEKDKILLSAKLYWVIRGKLDDRTITVYTGILNGEPETLIIPGTKTQNRASIKRAVKVIPAVQYYVSPSQFYVGE